MGSRYVVKPMKVRGSLPRRTLYLVFDLAELRRTPEVVPNFVVTAADHLELYDWMSERSIVDWQELTVGEVFPKEAELIRKQAAA